MDQDNGNVQDQAPKALSSLKGLAMTPSPYLATRVERNFESMMASSVKPLAKQSRFSVFRAAAVAAIFVFAIIGTWQMASRSQVVAQTFVTGQPYLVRIDVRELPQSEVAYAEISLKGESIQFSSEKFKSLAQNKMITIESASFADKQYLPIVVEGRETGHGEVVVSFYNSKNELISSRTMNLNFAGNKI